MWIGIMMVVVLVIIAGFIFAILINAWSGGHGAMDDRKAYAECKICSKRLLVECTYKINGNWCYDPEDLPEGWTYEIEPYPSLKNWIYCPEHSKEK